MNRSARPSRCVASLLLALLLAGCQSAASLFLDPPASDPLDGYKGSLAEAGISTEMDWGPKQGLLLSEFKTLKESHAQLENRVEQLIAENQNLKTQLANEGGSLQKEKAVRAQAEAEAEMLRQRRRELEARILSLSIEKAKLEQQGLVAKIDALRLALEEAAQPPAEPAAAPVRGQ